MDNKVLNLINAGSGNTSFTGTTISMVHNGSGSNVGYSWFANENFSRFNYASGKRLEFGSSSFLSMSVNDDGVGIGTFAPIEALEVIGGIKLGISPNTNDGAIQWDGLNFQGYKNGGWINLDDPADGIIYDTDGSLSDNRTVTMSGNDLTFDGTLVDVEINQQGRVGIGVTGSDLNRELEVDGRIVTSAFELTGGFYDENGQQGGIGQVLTRTATGVDWQAVGGGSSDGNGIYDLSLIHI